MGDDDGPDVYITGMDESDAYRHLDAVPKDDLRELVDKLREDADEYDSPYDIIDAGVADGLRMACDELEELIDDE